MFLENGRPLEPGEMDASLLLVVAPPGTSDAQPAKENPCLSPAGTRPRRLPGAAPDPRGHALAAPSGPLPPQLSRDPRWAPALPPRLADWLAKARRGHAPPRKQPVRAVPRKRKWAGRLSEPRCSPGGS